FYSYVSNNNIAINAASATAAAIDAGSTGASFAEIRNNTIDITSSSVSPTLINGIIVGGTGNHRVFANTFTQINLTGVITGTGGVISAVSVTAGIDSVYNNTITNITVGASGSTGSAIVDGILTAATGATVAIFNNKIFGITSNCGGVSNLINGVRVSAGGTNVNVYNNYIGNLSVATSANPDGVRGISITSTSTTSTNNIHFNTVFLNGTSSGANFGGSGLFHTFSTTATTSSLDLRNNIIINRMTPVGTGLVVALRRSSATNLNNYNTNSNKNLLYAGTPGTNKLIYYDGTNSDQLLADFKTRVTSSREAGSITGETTWQEGSGTPYETAGNFFQSLTGSASTYLHLVSGITTLVESGATVVSSPIAITQDYDGDTRNVSTPDIGADEFSGASPAPSNSNLSTPANVCNTGDSRTVTVDATTPSGTTITGVTITFNNGSATGPVAMTNTSGNTWSYDIPAGTAGSTVTWSVTSTNNIGLTATTNGTSFVYLPLNGATTSASAVAASVCTGASTTVSASLTNVQTKTLSAGASTSSSTASSFFPGSWGGAKTQYIIKASELQALGLSAGNITTIAYEPTTSGQTYQGFSVSLGHTALTAMTTAFVTTGLTQVYLGTEANDGYTPTANVVNNLAFGTGTGSSAAFAWDGTSNIVVSISWSRVPSASTSTSSTMKVDVAPFTSTAYRQADGETPAAMLASTTASGTGNGRPNFRFTGNAAPVVTGYSWSDGTGFTSTSATPSVAPAQGVNTYTVHLTAGGCSTTASTTPASPSVQVTGLALPAAPNSDNTPTTQCGVITYTATGASVGSYYTFYNVPTGGTKLDSNTTGIYQMLTPDQGNINTVYVAVTSPSGCVSATRTQFDVYANVPATLSLSQSTVSSCVGRVEALSVATGLSDYDTYTWSPTTNLYTNLAGTIPYTGGSATTVYYKRSSATTSETITVTAVNTTSGSGNEGCTNTASVIMTVNANPVITSATATPASVCSGGAVALNGTTQVVGTGTATVGTGTLQNAASSTSSTAYPAPFGNYYGGAKNQMLITAADLVAAGLRAGDITSVAFDVATPSTAALEGFNVSLKTTSLTVLTAFETTGFTTVYSNASYTPSSTAGYAANTITFSTPFNWDGTSNIIIQTCFANAGFATNAVFNQSNTSYQSTLVYRADLTTVCSSAPSITFSYSQRPNMKFGGQALTNGVGNLTWSWSNGTSNVLSAASGTVNPTNAPAGSANINVVYTVTGTSQISPFCSGTLAASAVTVRALAIAPTNTSLLTQCGTPTFSVSTGLSGSVTYKWYDASSGGNLVTTTTSSSGSSSYLYTGYTAGTINHLYVSVTATGGCESDRTDVAIDVQTPPTLALNTADTIQTCVGNINTVDITTGGGSTFDTYSWSPNTNLYTDAGASVAYTGNPQTVYYKRNSAVASETIVLTATNNTTTCVATATVVFKVGANPVVTSATISPSIVCNKDSVTLKANSTGIATGTASLGAGATISSSTGASFFPGGWGGAKTQYIILASELQAAGIAAGNISSLAFAPTNSGQQYQGFSVRMGHTALTATTTTFVTIDQLSLVYKGTEGTDSGFTPAANVVNTLAFGTGAEGVNSTFNWNGTSNIVIQFCWSRVPSATTSTSTSMGVDAPGFTCSVYKQADSQTPAQMLAQATGTTSTSRPKFTFGGQVATNLTKNYNWTWSTTGALGASLATGDTTKHSTNNPGSTAASITYTAIATNPSTGCYGVLNGTAITVNPTPTSPANTSLATQCGTPTFSVSTSISGTVTYKWYDAASAGNLVTTTSSNSGSSSYIQNNFTGGGATNSLWVSVTDPTTGCESGRTQLDVTVNTPVALSVTPASLTSVCAGSINTISVNSGAGTYTTLNWTPTTNLYTDAGATVAYNGTGNPTVLYYKRSTASAADTIRLAASYDNSGTTCSNNTIAIFNVIANPTIDSTLITPTTICSGSAVSLYAGSNNVITGTATIGAGAIASTSTAASFFPGFWGGAKTQYIIKASELKAAGITAGNLTSLTFETTTSGQQYQGFYVHLGQTAQAAATTTFINSGLTQVYLGTEGANNGFTPDASNPNTLTFGTGSGSSANFNWDGTSNIVVSISWSRVPSASTATASSMNVDNPGFTCSVYTQADNQTPAQMLAQTTGTSTGTSRPKFTFGAQLLSNNDNGYNWSWSNGTSNVLSANTGTINPTNITASSVDITYSVTATLAAAPSCSTTKTSVATVTVNPIPPAPTDNGTVANQCGLPTYTVSTSISSPTINWYTVASGGTPISTGSSLSYVYTGYTVGVNTLYVSVTSNGCEGARTAIAVTVSSPAAIALTNTSTVATCVDRIETLSVTGATVGNYSNFSWAPTTNLYTDAAATVAYNGTGNPTTVYYKRGSSNSAEVITLNVSNSGVGACVNATSVTMNVNANPNITTLTATPGTVCSGSTVNLSGTSIVAANGTTTIGNATTTVSTNGIPYRTGNGAGNQIKNQYLVLASELTAAGVQAGNLTSIGFDLTSATGTMTGMTFKVAATSATTLTTTFETPSFTTVLTEASYVPVVGTNTHTFSTPFNWNGTSNIVFELCGTVADGSGCVANAFTTTGFNASNHAASSTTACTLTTGTTSARPVIFIGGVVGTNVTNSLTWAWTTTHSGGTITNGASTTHIPTNTTNAAITAGYSVTVTNVATTCVSTGNTNTVTVNYIAAAPTNATTISQCGTPTYAVTTAETGATINWYTKATGGTALSSGSSLSYVYTTYPTNASGNDTLWASVTKNGCESGRTQIIVAVGTPPTLTLSTPTASTCVDRIATLSVSSTLSNYNVYTWSPTTNLYTDAAATVAYNGTGNPTTIYYKRGTVTGAETITLSASNASGCVNIKSAVFAVNANPVITTATASATAVCSGGNVTLTAASNFGAPGTIDIGTSTSTTTSTAGITPYNSNWEGSRVQYLVRASELTAAGLSAGNISSLAFNVTTKGAGTFAQSGFTIKMAHTSATALSGYGTPTGSFATVYGPANVAAPNVGYNTFTFASSFAWDGISNILVDICHDNDINNTCASCFSSSSTVAYTATSYNSTYGSYADDIQSCGVTATSLPTTFTNRPNMRFGGQIGPNYTSSLSWSWNNGSSTVLSAATGTVNPVNLGTTNTTVSYSVTATDANTCS
ncbi:MAG: hypothetical protein ACOVOV_01925, partial [Dolichospermum sp.]